MKRYLLLLPAVVAVYALWLCARLDTAAGLLVFGPVLLGFALHTLTRLPAVKQFRWAKFLPLGLLAVPTWGAVYEAAQQGFFWQLGVALWLGLALLYVLGWVSAFGLEGRKDV